MAAALPYHCSHEDIQIGTVADRMRLLEGRSMRFDDETLHIIQQFAAFSSSSPRSSALSAHAPAPITPMIETNVPTLERLSVASGLSKRTFQRCLAEERTRLTELLDEVRRDIAMAQLGASEQKLAAFGCVQQSALARAVKRRTGNALSKLRIDAADQHP